MNRYLGTFASSGPSKFDCAQLTPFGQAASRARRGTDDEGRFTGKGVTGLTFERRWTTPGIHPYDEITWELRSAEIKNESGGTVFEQTTSRCPRSGASWRPTSSSASTSAATSARPSASARQAAHRPRGQHDLRLGADPALLRHDEDLATFKAELTHLLVHQKMSFNSPVWFNVGVEEKPQCSACFINSVQDNMGSIMDLAKTEAMLFKYGSGAGVNLSPSAAARSASAAAASPAARSAS
jgi:ribonucleoside-diphosphate reductase alpha chain